MTPTVRPVQPTFLRLDGRIGWQMSANSEQIHHDKAAGGIRLGDENATAILPTEPSGSFGGLTRPTGLAIAPHGRLFLADAYHHRILTYTSHDGAFVPLWEPPQETPASGDPPNPFLLDSPRGVTVSPGGDLVVADTGHGRILIYTWPGLSPRQVIDLDGGEPWDLAYDSAGDLYVADAAAGCVRRFDRLWREDTGYHGGAGSLQKPRHLALDDADRLFVLDEGLRRVVALDARGHALTDDDLALHTHTFPPPLRLEGGRLWLPQDELPHCPALKLAGLEVDRRGNLKGQGLRLLARPAGVEYPRLGRYVSEALDSDLFHCAWHRLVLEVALPPLTALAVRTYTGPAELQPERIASLPDDHWSSPLILTADDRSEVLIQSPPGRYLWLQIELSGNGEATPLIHALTLYAPRQSSLAYLPPVFHEDPASADFLDRFLSYFDTIFQEIETQIERFTGYLDPDGVPPGDFLAWLGSWLDVEFLAEWPDETRRAFVRQAIDLYKQRGTVRGLQAILRLHTGLQPPQPVVIEHFRLREYEIRRQVPELDLPGGKPYLAGRPFVPAQGETAHHFTVVVPEQAAPDDEALATLHRLIDAQKPAHTCYQLRVVKAGLRIGCQSTVGVDALIGPYPHAPLGAMTLKQSSQLAPAAPAHTQLGRSRLSFDP